MAPAFLRRVTRSQVDELVRLEDRCFRSYYRRHRFDAGDFERYLAADDTILRLVAAPPKAIGYVIGRVTRRNAECCGRIESIAVLPAWRRRGLGGRLLQVVLRSARASGCRRVWLDVAERNAAAISLFRSRGFRPKRRLPDHYGRGVHGLRMRLELEA